MPNPSAATMKPSIPTANPSKLNKDKGEVDVPRPPTSIQTRTMYKIKLDNFETILQTDARMLYLELDRDPDEFWETDIKKAMNKSTDKMSGVGAL